MVWKTLIRSDLGVSFLNGCERVFDEHVPSKPQDEDNMEVSERGLCMRIMQSDPCVVLTQVEKPSLTWKERFQYLLNTKTDLQPAYFRVHPSRLHPLDTMAAARLRLDILFPVSLLQSMRVLSQSDSEQSDQLPLGCKHYRRGCKLFAACCGRFFVCRHCHDEHIHTHRIDRYATRLVVPLLGFDRKEARPLTENEPNHLQMCMDCKSIQRVQQGCASAQCNNKPMGR